MKQYHEMLQHILDHGEERKDRTGTGTIGVFGYQNRYDLSDGFPLVTTKFVPLRVIFYELMWFLKGDSDIKYLLDNNVNIWNEDAYRWYKTLMTNYSLALIMTKEQFLEQAKEEGFDLGSIYGKQWRSWGESDYGGEFAVDQIANVIESIKNDPYGRRHIVNAWNVGELENMALPPCHMQFQFYVSTDGKLSCQLYQRSADAFLGVPFNIASYSLLIHMIAEQTGLKVGEFIHTFGDLHIYKNHIEQVKEQLSREPKPLPTLKLSGLAESIDDYEWEDIRLIDYVYDPAIKGDVSVG